MYLRIKTLSKFKESTVKRKQRSLHFQWKPVVNARYCAGQLTSVQEKPVGNANTAIKPYTIDPCGICELVSEREEIRISELQ